MEKFWNFLRAFALFTVIYTAVNTKSVLSRNIPVGIVNGTDAKEGEFPYLVQIRDDFKDFRCGGSIIGDKWVLTAGHCVREVVLDSIVYGSNVLYSGKDAPNATIKIKNMVAHPGFGEVYTPAGYIPLYDLGILELEEPMIFGDNARPIKLAEAGEAVPFHVNGTLAGWGVSRTDHLVAESYLQKIQLQLLTDSECRKRIGDYVGADIFNGTHDLCSDDHWNGECYGDSGSPFVINGTQYGVVSWSFKPCGSNPGTYSRITTPDYRQFIKDVTGI